MCASKLDAGPARAKPECWGNRAPEALRRLAQRNGLTIVPGMPVEAFIKTGSHTALSYFVKPLTDQIMRTFRAG